jgi:hypothetical protein
MYRNMFLHFHEKYNMNLFVLKIFNHIQIKHLIFCLFDFLQFNNIKNKQTTHISFTIFSPVLTCLQCVLTCLQCEQKLKLTKQNLNNSKITEPTPKNTELQGSFLEPQRLWRRVGSRAAVRRPAAGEVCNGFIPPSFPSPAVTNTITCKKETPFPFGRGEVSFCWWEGRSLVCLLGQKEKEIRGSPAEGCR